MTLPLIYYETIQAERKLKDIMRKRREQFKATYQRRKQTK